MDRQPGYQEGSERTWWWKVAQHLDEAQLALATVMAPNLDGPTPTLVLQDKIREAQAILLEIFRAKDLLPASANGAAEAPTAPKAEPPEVTFAPEAEEPGAAVEDGAVPAGSLKTEAAKAEDPAAVVPEVAVQAAAQEPEVQAAAQEPEVQETEESAALVQDAAAQDPDAPKAEA